MKRVSIKKMIIPNIPYVFFALLFTKIGQAVRYASGTGISEKALHILEGFSHAMHIR